MRALTIKTPGKLMVAGEFAVLEPHQKLVVMAVDRFVHTKISASEHNVVQLPNMDLHHVEWEMIANRVEFSHQDGRTSFVRAALEVTLTYLKEKNIHVPPFTLHVHSELDDPTSGAKYGLGSSAAVVTSVVKAILTFGLESPPSDDVIFKLATVAHVRTQGNGSGADIAASTYGGVLEYTSFQAEWLLNELEQTEGIVSLIEKEWIYLSIKQTAFPSGVEVSVGWTGKPASTKSLVNDILALRDATPEKYASFLQGSRVAVAKVVRGMEENDIAIFLAGISKNRRALASLGEDANVPIETKRLAKLSDIAEQFGGAGKLSGAGGGDCGLAFVEEEVNVPAMHKTWITESIEPLDIHIYQGCQSPEIE